MKKGTPASSSIVTQDNPEPRKDVLPSLDLIKQTLKNVEQETEQLLENTSAQTTDEVTETLDLSPLVNELISSSSFDEDSKELDNIVPSDLSSTSTADVVSGNSVSDLYVGELPVLDLCSSDLSNLSETSSSNVSDASTKERENVLKQLDTMDDLLQPEMAEVDMKKNIDNSTTKHKQDFVEMKKDVQIKHSGTIQDAESYPNNLNLTEQVGEIPSSQNTADTAKSDVVEIGESAETIDNGRSLKFSKEETTKLPDVPNNEENLDSTPRSKNNVISVDTPDPITEIFPDSERDKQFSETCRSTNVSNESIETSENKQNSAGSNLESEIKNLKDTVNTREEDKNIEMVESNRQENDKGAEVVNKISNTTTSQESKTEGVRQEQSSKDDDGKEENVEEQLSGSEILSHEESLVRTSNRKRKAPPPRDLSVHPPGWVRSALQ